jgi:arabinose-5-phosphate isomerase
MSQKGLGMTAVLAPDGGLAGIFTDGDLRRLLDRDVDVRTAKIADVMIPNPRTIREDVLAVEAARMMEQGKINGLFALDAEGRLTGALNMHDLLRAGVV